MAQRLVGALGTMLDAAGLGRTGVACEAAYVVAVVAVALLLGWAAKRVAMLLVGQWVGRSHSAMAADVVRLRTVERASRVVPPLVLLATLPVALDVGARALARIEAAVGAYLLAALAHALCALMEVVWSAYDRRDNTRNLPLKGILDVAKGLVWTVVAIAGAALLLGKSPAALLTGLGAFAAALLLILRDSLLGLVAGVQMSVNDMLHVGDWIAVPGTVANGIVTDVSLTAVKVRNWDNTTVTLPPHMLVANGFQNWTDMHRRGRRQIERSVLVDVATVAPATEELLARVARMPYMADYIAARRSEEPAASLPKPGPADAPGGSLATNLGLFRAYVGQYVGHHPWVAQGGPICMVRLLEQTPQGMPLQVFCYLNTTDWASYEDISSELFEHIIAAAPDFGLSAYSLPSGRDVVNAGNPHPQAMPYYGGDPLPATPYRPTTNTMTPPDTSGDPAPAP